MSRELTMQEQLVWDARHNTPKRTHKSIASDLGVSRTRVWQIEQRAARKLGLPDNYAKYTHCIKCGIMLKRIRFYARYCAACGRDYYRKAHDKPTPIEP